MNIEKHPILIVTNASPTLESLRALLEPEHPLAIVGLDQDPVEFAKSHTPSLAIVDVQSEQAEEVVSRLKQSPSTSVIPILVAVSEEKQAIATLASGAMDCLVAPFEPHSTKARITNYLNYGRCVDALRHFSQIDEVTGIANRRRFEEFLSLEWRRNLRNQTQLSILLLDLDLFTAYNQHYGNAAGDACLREIATALVEVFQRPGDLIARYGRGGFACVLPETDTLGAVSVAERMRAEILSLAIPHELSTVAPVVTPSIGVATGIPLNGAEPEDLITVAERHLFDAKRTGRNRVMFG